jgi:hypothetical protein
MRRLPQQHANPHVRREPDRRTFTRQAALLAACALLAAGFIFAARQKIAAVQYGYRSEELRRERERLLEEQQRLLVEIGERSAPERLDRAARELGLQPARAAQVSAASRRASDDVGDVPASALGKSTLDKKEAGRESSARPGAARSKDSPSGVGEKRGERTRQTR